MIALAGLRLGGASGPWAALGFAVGEDSARVGGVILSFTGNLPGGLAAWTLAGPPGPAAIDGLPTAWAGAPAPGPAPEHPNGARRLDHVVVTTPDLPRTEAALAAAGLERRRVREAGDRLQSFYRLGEVVLEVVGPAAPAEGPAGFWGLVAVVEDLDALAARLGPLVGAAHDAVQPGRRIATVRREAGLGLPVAFMTP